MSGTHVAGGENLCVHELPLQKWRFLGGRASWGFSRGACPLPPLPGFKLWGTFRGVGQKMSRAFAIPRKNSDKE